MNLNFFVKLHIPICLKQQGYDSGIAFRKTSPRLSIFIKAVLQSVIPYKQKDFKDQRVDLWVVLSTFKPLMKQEYSPLLTEVKPGCHLCCVLLGPKPSV